MKKLALNVSRQQRQLGLVLCCGALVLATLVGESVSESGKKKGSVLRHVVLFKFNETTTPEQVREVEQAFAALPGKIDTIIDFEFGTDVSVENKADGFTHCFVVTFRDEKGRETYLPHDAHQAFVRLVRGKIEKVLVIDFWTQS